MRSSKKLSASSGEFEVFNDEHVPSTGLTRPFGLAAGVFTRDVDHARRVSRSINAGTVWTNAWFAINTERRVRRMQSGPADGFSVGDALLAQPVADVVSVPSQLDV